MKKILLIIICCFCLQFGVNAQNKTYIPDTAVRNWMKGELNWQISYLNTNWLAQYGIGYKKQCFKGDTLLIDSLHDHETTFNSYYPGNNGGQYYYYAIDLSHKNIWNMEGLQYFHSFLSIDLSHNHIDSLGYRGLNAYLGYGVAYLYLNNNLLSGNAINFCQSNFTHNILDSNYFTSFTSSYGFGNTLQNLSLRNNQITNLAIADYGGLLNIDLSYNKILSADIAGFNNSNGYAGRINLSHNLLTHIPSITPIPYLHQVTYEIIDLSYNNITEIDTNVIIIDPSSNLGMSPYTPIINLLDLSHNNISKSSSDALLSLTIQGKWYVKEFNLSNNNLNNSPELYEGITNYNCSNNNIYCLPKLPSTLQQLVIDTNKTTCIPSAGNFTLNGHNSAAYPVCNPTNNINGCKGFPTFTGVVFLDKNNNGIKDVGEPAMQNRPIHLTNGNWVYTDNNGRFSVSATDTGNHTIRITVPKYHTAFPDSITAYFDRYDTTIDVGNIPIQLTTIFDSLSIATIPLNWWAVRPGSYYAIRTYYQNVGSTTLSPTITLNYDNTKLTYNSCSNVSSVNNGNNISFNINNLDADVDGNATVYFTVNSNAVFGDTITTHSTITANAAIAQDSTFAIVRGSYDPNEKDATPELSTTQLSNGEYVDYTIHFQNTGNDTAFNIVVADTLSSKLQASSLQVVTSSHNCKTTLNDNKLYFEFRDILLPDSNVNLLGSNGFVRFRVKPINSLVVGDSINNKSSIYFDYNKPVLTNTATTKIVTPVLVPLKFTNYELRFKNDKQVENKWVTANEINVSHINVQRSLNSKYFVTIHKEQAKNKTYNVYSFIDETPNEGLNYYRLESVDRDGIKSYSEVLSVNIHKATGVTIFPNPTKDFVTIESNGIKNVTVTDCFGRVVYKADVNCRSYIVNLKSFAKGIYIFSFDNGEKVKMVKE